MWNVYISLLAGDPRRTDAIETTTMSTRSARGLIFKFESREALDAAVRGDAIPMSCRWWDPVRESWSGIDSLDAAGRRVSKDNPLYLLDIANRSFSLAHASSLGRSLPFNPWKRLYFKGAGRATMAPDGSGVMFSGEPNLVSAGREVVIPFRGMRSRFGKTVKVSGQPSAFGGSAEVEFTIANADGNAAFSALLNPASLAESFEVMSYETEVIDAYWSAHGRAGAAAIPLVGLSVILFVALLLQGASFGEGGTEMGPYLRWAASSTAATPFGEWWRLLVSQFTHYGVIHLLMNMIALYSIGLELEPLIGRSAVYVSYLFTGLAASIGSLLMHDQVAWSCGASGSIFGLIGVMMGCLVMRSSTMPGGYAWASLWKYILYLIINVAYAANHSRSAQIDHSAHLFGLSCGFALGVACSLGGGRQAIAPKASYNWLAVGLLSLSLPFAALKVVPNRLSINDALFFDQVVADPVGRYARSLEKLFSLVERDALVDARKCLRGEATATHQQLAKALRSWEPQGHGAKEWRDAVLASLTIRAEQFALLDEMLGKNYVAGSSSEEADIARLSAVSKRAQESEDRIPEFYPDDEKKGGKARGEK